MRFVFGLFLFVWSGLALAGDVGKLDLNSIGKAKSDMSSGQPSEEQLATLAEQGYIAIIDLRGAGENRGYDEAAAVKAAGLEYHALPVANASAINFENASKLGELLEQYDGPVLMHCGSGNRVGALVALLEADRGASAEEALAAGRAAGLTRSEGLVRERLDDEKDD